MSELAWWKTINPLKWIEGIVGFLYLTLDQLCLRGNILSAEVNRKLKGNLIFYIGVLGYVLLSSQLLGYCMQ